jgi:hypothetical protein
LGDNSASFGCAGSVRCRSAWAIDLTGGVGLLRGFCADVFSSGLFFESAFRIEGCVDSFDTCAVGVAFGFGVSAGGVESVEAGAGGAVAIRASSGLTFCDAGGAAAPLGVSAGGAEAVEAGAGGGVAIGASCGLTICEAAGAAARFGVSAWRADSVEAGVDGAVGIGASCGFAVCEAAGAAARFGGAA